jgi:DNA/RNA-binding protein KIN17
MNATGWTTLSGFVRYLGRTGKAIVEETPKGWYIQYINRDPEVLARQEALEKKEKHDLSDEERTRQMLEKRIQASQKRVGNDDGDDDGVDGGGDGSGDGDEQKVCRMLCPIAFVKC